MTTNVDVDNTITHVSEEERRKCIEKTIADLKNKHEKLMENYDKSIQVYEERYNGSLKSSYEETDKKVSFKKFAAKQFGEYKKKLDDETNKRWNRVLDSDIGITPEDHQNMEYVNFYRRNNIVLVPSHFKRKGDKIEYYCRYAGMKETNWNIIDLLRSYNKGPILSREYYDKTDPDNDYDILLEDDDDDLEKSNIGKPNHYYYAHRKEEDRGNNSIEAYTGINSNLITVDIDYAFKCFDLFFLLVRKSTLCTRTQHGYHFHYKFNDKLRTSIVFKDRYGFDIKNNTCVRMPPSYYYLENDERFVYKFFNFNDPDDMPDTLIEFINKYGAVNEFTPINSITDLKIENLKDKVFLKIIDLLPVNKSKENHSWKLFGRICCLLGFSLEYFDYFSKKSEEEYDPEGNIRHYNFIYEQASKDRALLKQEKADQKLRDEYDSCKPVLINWIKEADKSYLIDLKNIDIKLSNTTVAEYLIKHTQNKYIYQFGEWFCFDRKRWTKHSDKDKLYLDFDNIVLDMDVYYFLTGNGLNSLKKLGTKSFRIDTIGDLSARLLDTNIKFDQEQYLLGFESKVYDLKNKELRNYRENDYVTMSVGYDLPVERDSAKEDKLKSILKEISEEDYEFIKVLLARSLLGQTFEKFTIFQGNGGNGKSLLLDFMQKVLGEYAYKMHISSLIRAKISDGPDPAMAQLANKRLVIASETPGDGASFNTTIIKTLTGGDNINARECHSNKTQHHICCTMIVDTNHKLPFQGEIDNALVRRLIDLEFPNNWTDDLNKVGKPTHNNGYYKKADEYYKTKMFHYEYKASMMYILLDNFVEKIEVPESIMKRSYQYLTDTHPIFKWFLDNYKSNSKQEEIEYIQIKDILADLKSSDYYKALTKTKQKQLSTPYLITLFTSNDIFKENYIDEIDIKRNGKRYHKYNLLKYWEKIRDNQEDEESMEKTYDDLKI